MSFFSGPYFFISLIVLLIPACILGLCEKNIKIYRILLSIFFIYEIYKNTPVQLLYLVIYVIVATLLVCLYIPLRRKYERNRTIYYVVLVLSLLPLIIYKVGYLFECSIFGFLGISYICFRIVQVIIEIYDGVIKEIKPIQFIEFLIFFPSLSSGPIDRSRRFNEDDDKTWSKEEYRELLSSGVYKLVLGIFYKTVCSSIFYNILQNYIVGKYSPLYLIAYSYVYGLYMFFDFAGYSSMAIGTAYILGIKLPENFNKPFLSIDIKDFWNRWHISLSTWFRDFIFSRFLLNSARKKRFKNRLTGAAIGFVINMTIMGIWHGFEPYYILYGLYHGIILAITEIYQKKSNFYRKYKDNKLYKVCSWFITINIVMFGFLIFSGYLYNQIIDYIYFHFL